MEKLGVLQEEHLNFRQLQYYPWITHMQVQKTGRIICNLLHRSRHSFQDELASSATSGCM